MMINTLLSALLIATGPSSGHSDANLRTFASVDSHSGGEECAGPGGDPALLSDPARDDLTARAELDLTVEAVRADLEGLRERRFADELRIELADREWLSDAIRGRWDSEHSLERIAQEEKVAKMLGMLPAEASLREEELRILEQATTFFDADQAELYLLDRGAGASPFAVAIGLSEVLSQQLFDERFGPWAADATQASDARWVQGAMRRGSAVSLLLQWAFENLDGPPLAELSEFQRSRASLADSPPYVWRPALGSTLRGDSFLRRSTASRWISPPRLSDLDRVVTELPLSSEQVLHPDKYWTERHRDDPTEIRFGDVGEADTGWTDSYQDTLGEVLLSILTLPFADRSGVDPSLFSVRETRTTSEEAAGWDGDRVVLLENAVASVVHLVSSWDSAGDADEFLEAIDDQREDILDNLSRLGDGPFGMRAEVLSPTRVSLTTWMGTEASEVEALLATIEVAYEG